MNEKQAGIKARLRELRKKLGLKQAEMSERLGATKSLVGVWETTETEVPTARLYQIAEVFNCRREWLETGDGEMFDFSRKPEDDEIKRRVLMEMWERLTPEQQLLIKSAIGLLENGLHAPSVVKSCLTTE